MDYKLSRVLSIGSLVGVMALGAGCSGGSSPSTPSQPAQQQSAQRQTTGAGFTLPDLGVDVCKTAKTESVFAAGGSFVLPPCAKLKGTVTYAGNNAQDGQTTALTSYATNPGGVPVPSKGKVLVFVKSHGSGSNTVTFSGTTSKLSKISGEPIILGHDYQLYAYALGFLAPGFPVDLGMPKADDSITFASPLQNGEAVPGGIDVYFELVQN